MLNVMDLATWMCFFPMGEALLFTRTHTHINELIQILSPNESCCLYSDRKWHNRESHFPIWKCVTNIFTSEQLTNADDVRVIFTATTQIYCCTMHTPSAHHIDNQLRWSRFESDMLITITTTQSSNLIVSFYFKVIKKFDFMDLNLQWFYGRLVNHLSRLNGIFFNFLSFQHVSSVRLFRSQSNRFYLFFFRFHQHILLLFLYEMTTFWRLRFA